MKKIMSSVVAALVALSFSAVAFAAEGSAPTVDESAPAVEKKEMKKGKTVKAKKSKSCAAKKTNKTEKKEESPAPEVE